METEIIHSISSVSDNRIFILKDKKEIDEIAISDNEKKYILGKLKKNNKAVSINRLGTWDFFILPEKKKSKTELLESFRRRGNEISAIVSEENIPDIEIKGKSDEACALAEGLILGSYKFRKYFSEKDEKKPNLKKVVLCGDNIKKPDIEELQVITESVYRVRDLVNEPLSYLTAEKLAEIFKSTGKEAGFTVDVFHKQKIESLKMGGLLAVNQGSIDPPTFSVLEWKPEKPKNKKPVVLVGKGIVYDTGGLSLKPTPNSMDLMKSDMAGGAVVAGVLYAVSMLKLPVHVIALVPATDNRPSGNAYAPGDVITMHSGKTVEVLNTDAEGRLILADALSYASKYKPELVVDIATLTGSAEIAVGRHGIVTMGTAKESYISKLKEAGDKTHERIVEFPVWEEYGEMLKSDIADMKNLGGREAGAITAGKFLENFTSYPWIHLDIAGVSFFQQPDNYRVKGATGTGTRLLFEFIKNLYS
jgi:leucyl aminopeptidase